MIENLNYFEKKVEERAKKRQQKYGREKMRVSGKSVFLLQRLAAERAAKIAEGAAQNKKLKTHK